MNIKMKYLFIAFLIVTTISFSCAGCESVCTGPNFDPDACNSCCAAQGGTPGTPSGGDISVDSVKIKAALLGLCTTIKDMLGVGMMLMIVSAAIVYSVGQVMGAETRARASVWATSMFNGAIIAALIYLIVPWMLNKMLEQSGVIVGC